MNGDAIVMMLLAMFILWGGLVGALVNLRRSPEAPTRPAHTGDG